MPVILGALGLFVIILTYQVATLAAHSVWPVFAVVVLILGAGVLYLWQRHLTAWEREARSELGGFLRRLNKVQPWPKVCHLCGVALHDWKSVRAHMDPGTSACAAFRAHQESAEPARPMPWTAVVEQQEDELEGVDDRV
jgi:hypothetical protein